MSDIEFFSRIKPKRLISLEEDFKESQAAFRKDELNRELRRSGRLKQDSIDTFYERFPVIEDLPLLLIFKAVVSNSFPRINSYFLDI